MAPLMDPMVGALAEVLADEGWSVEFDGDMTWQERERAFDRGEIDLLWICGLPYVEKRDRLERPLQLVAAPIMAAARYQGKPIYFSDVLVRTEAKFKSFADLAGARWAFNEPNSQSGFNLTRWHLARLGLDWSFFGSVRAAGSHEAALDLLLKGEIDAAAIDSTVWELAAGQTPSLRQRLRNIQTLGPSPIPPWVAPGNLEPAIFDVVQEKLLQIHQSKEGRAALALAGIVQMVRVTDQDYDSIRKMKDEARIVRAIEWVNK